MLTVYYTIKIFYIYVQVSIGTKQNKQHMY